VTTNKLPESGSNRSDLRTTPARVSKDFLKSVAPAARSTRVFERRLSTRGQLSQQLTVPAELSPAGNRSFHPLRSTISGQAQGVAAAADQAVRFYRTSTATNRGGDVGSTLRPALLPGGFAPSTEVVRIQRVTVTGWPPTF
jgi:hypothetical protein